MLSVLEVRALAHQLEEREFCLQLGPFVLIQRPARPLVAKRTADLAANRTFPSQRDRAVESALTIIQELPALYVATLPPVRAKDDLVVGRLPDCELVIEDPSVSKRHAILKWTGSGCCIRDLGSSNGTFVDEVAIGRKDHQLVEASVLSFGDVDFWFMPSASLRWQLSKWTEPT